MNKTAVHDRDISENYEVYYGNIPFPLPLYYNGSGLDLGVSSRYMALFPEVEFPSVVVDFDAVNDTYTALVEYLCWDVVGIDYVEVRISTRLPAPPAAYLDSLEARARALGVTWSGPLTSVNFSECPAFKAPAPLPGAPPPRVQAPRWARARAALFSPAPTHKSPSTSPLHTIAPTSDVILPGINPGLPQVALILIQGAEVPPSTYIPTLKAIQSACVAYGYNVIAGAPDAPLIHTPDPLSLGVDVARVLKAMEDSAGLLLNASTTRLVFAGHSLGGLVLQDWLAVADFVSYLPSAALLLGSYITRPLRPGINASISTPSARFPTLSLVGELDGLARVSRFAEAAWWQVLRQPPDTPLRKHFPVVHIPGMNHGQWAHFDSVNPPPSEVAQYDLPAEVTEAEAQGSAAILIAAYLAAVFSGNSEAAVVLEQAQARSMDFFSPLINASLFESSYYYIPPCYDAPVSLSCKRGSDFSQVSQQLLSNVLHPGGGLNASIPAYPFSAHIVDAMHPVADLTPIHLPNISNSCSAPTPECTLEGSTVTENVYDALYSPLDVALYPTSPHEVKVKLFSRQRTLLFAGVPPANAPFNVTDAPSFCAQINSHTLEDALARAAPATVTRFLRRGLQLRFGADSIGFAGPQFTDGSLAFALVNSSGGGSGGEPFVWCNSTSLPTPFPYFVPLAAGMHYCLLLSPLRALEWVYTDGLRPILLT